MQLVFMNTFEKLEGDHHYTARLTIAEEQGVWHVNWQEMDTAQTMELEVWYESLSWEELLTAFRHGVALKMGAGYVPVIESMLDGDRHAKGSYRSMLQCYGEHYGNEAVFQTLREWRRKKAAADRKSPFLIATNVLLWMISAYLPHNEEELRQIPGWGKARNEAYGGDILELTRPYTRETAFPLDWVAQKLDGELFRNWQLKQQENKYRNALERQEEKKRLLSIVQQGGLLSTLEEELKLPRRELLLRMEQLEQEGYELEPLVEEELRDVPEAEMHSILEVMTEKGDRYLKPVLEHVYGEGNRSKDGRTDELLYEKLRLIRIHFRRKQGKKAV
ncbi:aldolase [Paenibacillus oryzae]|uniref:Aldolase n=1 Tax=Paenibacillus oryzae TaxID=1844972 RepID=A0A1A5YBM0_9BACL|nr:HRDC domain-containing protein [Paenibacillus oryzae]OBR62994.1 aldolase [Paenibacillus oryzae]